MKLKELQDVQRHIEIAIYTMIIHLCRYGHDEGVDPRQAMEWRLTLAAYILVEAELDDHIRGLESVLEVCAATAKGRYLEDWQRCSRWSREPRAHGCTSAERCDGFDERTPYRAISDALEALSPLSNPLQRWIMAQLDLGRGKREAMYRLFDGVDMVKMGADDPPERETLMEVWAEEDKEDTRNGSMALRVDQYELNLVRIKQICQVQGDLQEVVTLITEGMPPQIGSDMMPS
jgi:hypothetical protein